MPRYEIVAHVVRELGCETAEDVATDFRRQLLGEARRGDALVHLGAWRGETGPATVPPTVWPQLAAFFVEVGRCAGNAEAAFRDRVEAVLMTGAAEPREGQGGAQPG
jgi:hypothetical protein